MNSPSETIAAAATPPGVSALAIVRLSGPDSLKIADKIFRFPAKSKSPANLKSHTSHPGNIVDDSGKIIDRAVITAMKAPASYTGEDMVEFSTHGSMLIVSRLLELCLAWGARVAEPGEFTKRAFLNGKIDLTRAEAVNNLIRARTENSRKQAMNLLRGALQEEVEKLRSSIEKLKMLLDADIEWGETENVDFFRGVEPPSVQAEKIYRKIKDIICSSAPAEGIIEGYRVVICGKPNAGKSSLFNALLDLARSIISTVPGTTRNVIEAETVIEGCLLRLVDTAGIGLEEESEIDKIAAYKSLQEIERADLAVCIVDAHAGIGKKDYRVRKVLEGKKWITALNKTDLESCVGAGEIEEFTGGDEIARVSCRKKKGIGELGRKIVMELGGERSEKLMISVRQKNLLEKILQTMAKVLEEFAGAARGDLISFELKQALNILGRIDGRTTDNDMLDRIFENFCIGK